MFVLELSRVGGVALAAVEEDAVVGYLVCSRYDTVWHVMNVAVDPWRRRRGIARAMLDALIAEVGPEARLTLEVRASNTPAIALYERYGFRTAGLRRRYYADNGEDALIMWRTPSTLEGRFDELPLSRQLEMIDHPLDPWDGLHEVHGRLALRLIRHGPAQLGGPPVVGNVDVVAPQLAALAQLVGNGPGHQLIGGGHIPFISGNADVGQGGWRRRRGPSWAGAGQGDPQRGSQPVTSRDDHGDILLM